ncbi:MAG: ABC transporter ATP-binding protein [Tissierellia bacterium]|nr:ABC transporter ATP-binding protein [Tissierellia bacterium]
MFELIKKKYHLSEEESKLMKEGIIYNALSNISKMLPVGICTYVLSQMFLHLGKDAQVHLPIGRYLLLSLGILIIMTIMAYIEYTKTFVDIYRESANRRIEITEFLRKLPLSFFSKRDLADLTTIIMTDIAGIEHALAHVIPQSYGTLISTCIICVAMMFLNFKLAISLFWVIPIAFLVVFLSRKLQGKYGEAFKNEKIKASDKIQMTLEMIKEIKAFGLERDYKKDIRNQFNAFEKTQRKTELFSATILASAQMILQLGTVTVIFMGSILLIKSKVDVLTYIIFLFSAGLVYEPVNALINSLTEIFQADILVNRIDTIKKEKIEENTLKMDDIDFSISFQDVFFGYDHMMVLKGISFRAEEGKKTAFVGTSGSGKSTALKLAAGFYNPDEGKVTIGGKDISKLNSEELLKYYSIVFQDVLLFDNTIMENIRLGNKNATDEEVIEAAKLAHCHEFISQLPQGYHTTIGENGKLLSGGEKQRISVARAIIKDAPIVLLDEVTSSLDIQNENLVQDAMNIITKNKTVIVIAHKLNTIKDCNNIIVFHEGKIVEQGGHDFLVNQNGMYKKLLDIGA